jgi:hypothetical protein
MPLRDILKNKLLLQENFHTSELAMDDWAFWQFEENIKVANSIIEEKEKSRRKDEEEQRKNMPSMPNMGGMNNNLSSMMNKFKK